MAVDRKQQMKEITERLEQGVKDIFTSEMYTTYLRTMAKFHNYSFNNTLLIAMQRPDATLVAGFQAWKNKFNRYVKKGEKGIQIIAPAPIKEVEEREKIDKDTGLAVLNENGEPEMERVEYVVPRFRVTTVFDVSQTDGEPIPSLEVNELTASVKDYALLTATIEQVSPVPIRFDEIEGDAKGYYSDTDKEICIQVGMGESQTIKTMIHEVAHAMLHNSDLMKQRGEEKDRLTKETEAESIAFTVCSALGIDTSDYSFPYVASWASGKEMKELKDSMDTIRLTAADFLEKLEAAVAERSAERMTAMQDAEKLIADREQEKTIFDDEQRNLIVNFAFKLDDRAATEELVNGLAAALAEDDKEEVNRLMYDAQEKIENLPDGMIGLSEMHDYGYRNHAASVLMVEELDLGAEGRLELGEEGLNFTGAELTVREFMEEQQQKNNALIHGDSDHIAVEGHIGTWYAVDETEIGGEKFFLLEHEEHGDMAACVAVNEQGKLVAEDLWNGFDEDFQEAVQKYFSEKWNMPKKEDVVSEIIEKAVPVPDNSAQDYSDVPVYYEPFSYAKENDEVDLYRTSYRLNSECKQAIHEAIADNYDGMYLGDDAVDQVVRQYGVERVGYILANTLHHKSYDGRFSHSNKEWAEQVSTPEHDADRMTFRSDWVVDSHPAILDGFVTMFREELDAQKELEQEQPFVKQFYVVENLQAVPLKIERFGNLDDAMSQYQALPNHYMKALGVEKNPDPLPGSLDILQCKNGIDTIVEDYKTVPGWDNPYIQNHVVQPLQGALAVQDVELAYELPDAYFHIQTCDDGFDYTLYNKDFTERDGGILETDGNKPVQEAMTELLAEFGCDAAEGKVMDAAELREQADTVAEQQAEVLKEKLAAERPAPEETLSFYVAECLEFTFAGEFHDHLTMEEALEAYDKIPSERMNADKCIGFCIEEDGGFVGMYELVVNDKVQRENINSINYFRDDKLVQQAISDMEKLMAARQQSKEQERGSTKKSVLDALRSLKAKKQEQPAQEQDKPKKVKKKGMEL